MSKSLLYETFSPSLTQVTTDEENNNKHYYIKGPFLMADVRNKNGRIYPLPLLEKEVKRFIDEKIKNDRAVGELNHPDYIDVNPENISHKIISLEQDKNIFYGKALILDTPKGLIVQKLLEANVKLGVSSRGVGELKNDVVQNYELITIDIVIEPSIGEFVESLVESKQDWIIENGIITEKNLDKINNIKENYSAKEYKDAVLEVFKNILKNSII